MNDRVYEILLKAINRMETLFSGKLNAQQLNEKKIDSLQVFCSVHLQLLPYVSRKSNCPLGKISKY